MKAREASSSLWLALPSLSPSLSVVSSRLPQEAKYGVPATEAAEVKLYCQIPPINKLDAGLCTLANCE